MYLMHLPILWLIEQLAIILGLLQSSLKMGASFLPVYTSLMFVVSRLSFVLIEMPSIQLGRRSWKAYTLLRDRGGLGLSA